jgi:quercetin dioxygenase-like cupin family protein
MSWLILLLLGCAPEPPAVPVEPVLVPVPPPLGQPSIVHVDVPAKAAKGAAQFKADWSFDLVASKAWSAHVHVIPQGQIVPWHRHPENDELVFVASGRGTWLQAGGEFDLVAGDAVESAPGVVHGVRNLDAEPLVTVVMQRPEFGQNWYVVPSEIADPGASARIQTEASALEGWQIDWWGGGEADDAALYLVADGTGSLSFEDTELPLRPGVFVKAPAGRARTLSGPGLRLLRVRIPGG